jgi:type I restriction enzyme, S subunit
MKTNWQTKKLGDMCDILDNKRKPVTQRDRISGIYPYYGATGIQDYVSEYIFDEKLILIGEDGAKWGPGENTAFTVEGKYWVNNHAHVIRPHRDTALDNWIIYFLNVNDLSKYITGLTVQKLNQEKLRSVEIPLPPLSEQKRILKILDEAFEKIEKAKEDTEKNLKNSKELFESYLQSVFINTNDNLEEKTLDNICDIEYGYTEKAKSTGDYRFIRITDTDEKGLLTLENKMYINHFNGANKYLLENGDLLMARTGASAGNVLFFESNEKSIFASYLIRIKFKKEVISKLYWYFSKSKLYWDQVRQLSAGSAQPQFNGGALKQVIFTFPKPLSEQKSIVKKLDELSEQTKKLEEIYKQKLADLEELKKSLLQKAFKGEL